MEFIKLPDISSRSRPVIYSASKSKLVLEREKIIFWSRARPMHGADNLTDTYCLDNVILDDSQSGPPEPVMGIAFLHFISFLLTSHDILKLAAICSSMSKKQNHWYTSRGESVGWCNDTWR
jgi:hypothetical protein